MHFWVKRALPKNLLMGKTNFHLVNQMKPFPGTQSNKHQFNKDKRDQTCKINQEFQNG